MISKPFFQVGATAPSAFKAYPRPTATGRKGDGKQTAQKTAEAALRIARSLARQVEVKALYFNMTTVDMLTGATQINSCVEIAQGDSSGQRTGIAVNLKRIDFSLRFLDVSHENLAWRVLVVQDASNDATILGTDVLLTSNTLSLYNPLNLDRFKILHDMLIQQQPCFSGQDTVSTYRFSVTGFRQGGRISYTGAAANTADHNKVWILVIADWATSAGLVNQGFGAAEALYSCNAATYYTDL